MAETKQIKKARLKMKGETSEHWAKSDFVPIKNELVLVHDKGNIIVKDEDNNTPIKDLVDNPKNYFLPISRGEAKDSIVSIGDEQNLGLSEDVIALGSYAVAGVKGYYYTNIDFENKQIYLSTTQATPPSVGAGAVDKSISLDYTIGNKIVVDDGNRRYFNEATIVNIQDNVVTYEGDLGFNSIASVSSPNAQCWIFFVINEYEKGQVSFGHNAVAIGRKVASLGVGSYAEGQITIAGESSAHAEGELTLASGQASHVEGANAIASGNFSHAEGNGTIASGMGAHAEGGLTKSTANATHAEGIQTVASANGAHAEGNNTVASGKLSHAEGNKSIASGYASHAEGNSSVAEGDYSRAAGNEAISIGHNSQAEGNKVFAGCRGYYWQAIDFESKKIYLCKEQTTPTIAEPIVNTVEEITEPGDSVQISSTIQNPYLTNASGMVSYEYVKDDTPWEVFINFINGTFLLEHFWNVDDGSNTSVYNIGEMISVDLESQPPANSYIRSLYITSATVVYKDDTAYIDTSFTPDYAVGDEIAIVNNNKYFPSATIRAIENNVITYQGDIGFTAINEVDSENYDLDDYSIYVITKPTPEADVEPSARICKELKRDSHAEGCLSKAEGNASHAEGTDTTAYGDHSHSEGTGTKAAWAAHSEGYNTEAAGFYSHTEGRETVTVNGAEGAHAEGRGIKVSGYAAHGEGLGDYLNGVLQNYSEATGKASHVEGRYNKATAEAAHAEGYKNTASGVYSHVEGTNNTATKPQGHTEGANNTNEGYSSHAEGERNTISTNQAHAEGGDNILSGSAHYGHVEGRGVQVTGYGAHGEGIGELDANNALKNRSQATGKASHVEGIFNKVTGEGAHAEGYKNIVDTSTTTAKLGNTEVQSSHKSEIGCNYSHVEGYGNQLIGGLESHIEGKENVILGRNGKSGWGGSQCHIEGFRNVISGDETTEAHVEGRFNKATAAQAHAEGQNTIASGAQSHAGGLGTKATAEAQTAIGKYNAEDNNALFIVGKGESDSNRSNAFIVDKDGNAIVTGDIFINGNSRVAAKVGTGMVASRDYLIELEHNTEYRIYDTRYIRDIIITCNQETTHNTICAAKLYLEVEANSKYIPPNIKSSADSVVLQSLIFDNFGTPIPEGSPMVCCGSGTHYGYTRIETSPEVMFNWSYDYDDGMHPYTFTFYNTENTASIEVNFIRDIKPLEIYFSGDHCGNGIFTPQTAVSYMIDIYWTGNQWQAEVVALNIDSGNTVDLTGYATEEYVDGKIAEKASASDLTAHISNTNNPHNVTAQQLGLSTETWTFTLEGGSTVTKAVYVG